MRIKPKANTGASSLAAVKAMLGLLFWSPPQSGELMTRENKTVNSGLSAFDFEHGWVAKWTEKTKGCYTNHLSPLGSGDQEAFPLGSSATVAVKGWLGPYMAWGSGSGNHGGEAVGWGGPGRPRCVKCVHFQRKRREVSRVWGWPWKEGLAPCLCRQHPPPGFGLHKPFPHHEGREPRDAGKKRLDPIKGQRKLTLCLDIPACR